MGFLDWISEKLERNHTLNAASRQLNDAKTLEALDRVWASLPADVQGAGGVSSTYNLQKKILEAKRDGLGDPLAKFIEGALSEWLVLTEQYGKGDAATAKENLAKLSAHVIEVAGITAATDIALGAWPGSAGAASASNTKQLMAWLGFGAVLTAVAHDPVKIGLLRPYQDSLEQTFRNRRPGDVALFQAYRTRELTPTKASDLSALNDTMMDQIENENQKYYDTEIAKWGYSEWFAGALARSATRTPTFGNLTTLARQGMLTRGMAIYSLWGYGMDRVTMKPAVDVLMALNDQGNYGGFRSMIEPSFVEGDISEDDLVTYYGKIGVPQDVQTWILPRMRKRREAYLAKRPEGAPAKERDLTVSQVQQAYENELIKGSEASNMLLDLGYSQAEISILMTLAEKRRKVPAAAKLKRLPLSDYEKAHTAGLISQDAVLTRMQGEYTAEDIALEKQLLQAGKA